MNNLSYKNKEQASKNLQEAFKDLKRKHSYFSSNKDADVRYNRMPSVQSNFPKVTNDIDHILRYIKDEENQCDRYVMQRCPAYYDAIQNSSTQQWTEQLMSEEKAVIARMKTARQKIKERSKRLGKEFVKSLFEKVKEYSPQFTTNQNLVHRIKPVPQRLINRHNFLNDGLGRPWGTEFRQLIANAQGLKYVVNDIKTLLLNSIGHSKSVRLGPKFIDMIKKDPEMKNIIAEIEKQIITDIKSRAIRAPYMEVEKIDRRLSGVTRRHYAFGGARSRDSMLKQFKFTITNPKLSLKKYTDTWNAGFNELTWVIRNCYVNFTGVYHAAYNVSGFAFIWEMELRIEDTLDLRPRNGGKINFDTTYNVITSVLGTIYHDWLGNSDKMKIRAKWDVMGNGADKIHLW